MLKKQSTAAAVFPIEFCATCFVRAMRSMAVEPDLSMAASPAAVRFCALFLTGAQLRRSKKPFAAARTGPVVFAGGLPGEHGRNRRKVPSSTCPEKRGPMRSGVECRMINGVEPCSAGLHPQTKTHIRVCVSGILPYDTHICVAMRHAGMPVERVARARLREKG